jgi:prophage maintenance system killer protein
VAHTVLDLADVIYSSAKVFDDLEAGRGHVEEYLRTGSLASVAAPHDRALLEDLRDVAAHVLDVTREDGVGFRVDAAFVSGVNARITRSGALHPGRLRIDGERIGVTTPLGRHEPAALSAGDLEHILSEAVTGRAPDEAAITLFVDLAKAQPFMDGNKRSAIFAANALLIAAGSGQLLTVPFDDHDPVVTGAFVDALAQAYICDERGPVASMLRERGLQSHTPGA